MISKSTYRQAQSNYAVWIISIVYGLQLGWTGPALKILISPTSPIAMSSNQVILLSVITTSGVIVGILLGGCIARSVGRKTIIATIMMLSCVAWTWSSFVTTVEGILSGKFFINIALGLYDVIFCIYISEVTTLRNRHLFISTAIIFFTLGVEMQYVIGLANSFQLLSIVPALIAALGMFAVLYTVESPYYLVAKDMKEEAWKSLSVLNEPDKNAVHVAYEELVHEVEAERSGGEMSVLRVIALPENRKLCACIFVMNALVYMSGVSQMAEYASIILLPFKTVNVDVVLNVFGIGNMVATLVSPVVVNHCSRRFLMIGGFFALAVNQLVIAACFYVESANANKLPYLPVVIIVCAVMSKMVYAVSVYPVIHVLRGEMFPYKLKENGSCVLVMFRTIMTGLASALFLPITYAFGIWFNFWMYSVLACTGGVFAYVYLIETKGKTFSEIRKAFI